MDWLPRVALAAVLVAAACGPAGPRKTLREPVTDTYHGVEVVDDYRWLEDWDDLRVRQWSDEQNRVARAHLEALPGVETIRQRVSGILRAVSVDYSAPSWRPGALFALKRDPALDQRLLVVMPGPDAPQSERVVVDPNALDASGSTSIDWYVPSPDGSVVAVSLSVGGSESGDVHFYDVSEGDEVGEVVPRVNGGTAGGDLAWAKDGSGFYFTRYPRAGERPEEELDFYQQLWFQPWGGSGAEARHELGEGMPKVAEIRPQVDPASGRVLATVQEGDSGRFELWLRGEDGAWSRLAAQEDEIVQAVFSPDGSLFMVSRQGAPRGKLLRLLPGARDLGQSEVIVEQGGDTLVNDFYDASPLVVTDSRTYATYQLGGPSTIRAFDHQGGPRLGPDVLPVSSAGPMIPLDGDAVLFSNSSYMSPRGWYLHDEITRPTGLKATSPVDLSGLEAVRELVVSKDGTRVPLNIIRPAGLPLDGSHPVLLTGYGGYAVSLEPFFDPLLAVWLEQGGVVAVANLRGGGEFGEEWHRAGMLTKKQNVFDDFAACMQYLIDSGYTSSERLAIKGGSNGGLLMGAMITQHPRLCRAVVSTVGVYDMLRVELSANGAFNIPEYGTVTDPEQFRALYAYSPYHHVTDGEKYPSVLFMTGANDPRVDPLQSRKIVARLQAATASGRPILLRTSAETGHGGGTPLGERIEEATSVFAFLFHELGVTAGG